LSRSPARRKILAGGDFTTIGGQSRTYIARLDPVTGSADSLSPGANLDTYAIALQADGKSWSADCLLPSADKPRNHIARIDPSRGLADSFDANANNLVFSFAFQADGKILVGGVFTNLGGQTRNRLARLDPANRSSRFIQSERR